MRNVKRAVLALTTVVALTVYGIGPAWASGGPSTVTDPYGYTAATSTFTVPPNVTSLTLTLMGGQGGWGGADSSGNPPAGGYQGEVTGTIAVTPGEFLTIAVGAGADEPYYTGCTRGKDASSPTDAYDAVAGLNPLAQYDGGMGGAPGPNGCSGYGGAGGAATVVEVGSSPSSPTSVGTVVAGGGGGDGGSGQYALVRGQIGLAAYVAQSAPTSVTYGLPAGCTGAACSSHDTVQSPSALPTYSTQGQAGTAVFTLCGGTTNANNADQYFNTGAPNSEAGCDGGGGAGGGGGMAGGSAGSVQFGSGSSDEWYGQGGSPGENSTGGLSGLSAFYAYYPDTDTGTPSGTATFADPGAAYDGSVTITYATGAPGAPTAVTGTVGNGTASLQWAAPASPGTAAISDYTVQYSSDGGASWVPDDTGANATSTTVTGLTNGTGYIFEVDATNSIGTGPFSSPSTTFTPSGPPGAPAITSISPEDGGLQVNFAPPSSTLPISGYLYQLDGTGPWHAGSATSSPLMISGLNDGTSYSVQIEAVNAVGAGPPSGSSSQTPQSVPGAPTISSVEVGPGTASVAFTPGSSGGGTITAYQYSVNAGPWVPTSASSPITLASLANGTVYGFQLEAVNSSGTGEATSTSFTTPSAPAAPVISSVTPEDQALQVALGAPASGGYPLTDYEWSTDAGATWYSESSHGTPCPATSGTTVTCQIAALSSDGATPLTNGTSYSVEMRAVNDVGAGAASALEIATPYTSPGAPTITTTSGGMTPSDGALTVSFTAPTDDGGAAITGYQHSTDGGVSWAPNSDLSLTFTITGLTNGTSYPVEVRAVNAAGAGLASAVASGIPSTVPAPPVISAVTPANQALTVSLAPESNGGAAVTAYEYSVNGGAWTPTAGTSPAFTVRGLTNGTSYAVEVLAENSNGSSGASAPVSATPVTVPGQPVITATTRGNATIVVSCSSPSSGGSPIASYQYSTDGGTTWQTLSTTTSPLVITALSSDGTTAVVNGTDYSVEVRAVNVAGASVASAPVDVSPAAAPEAPVVSLTAGDGTISVTAVVAGNGGSPVTGFDYSLNGGTFAPTGATSPNFAICGLTNGTSYTVSVRADNAIGEGTASSPAGATPSTVPGAPTDVIATSDSASADVSWAPRADGGSPVTGYTATAYTTPSGTVAVGTPCATATVACSVTGLANGTTYYLGVVATNAQGPSAVSWPLQAVAPVARPGAPALTGVTTGDSYLSLVFTAGSAGGDPITSYQYSLDDGSSWHAGAGTSSPLVISGLVDGTSYTVTLRAVSAAGPGAASNPRTATPYTYPASVATSTISVNGEDAQVAVSWTVPADGGSPITAAQATAFSLLTGGAQDGTCTATSNLAVGDTATCTITGLTDGVTYYVSIQSDNAAGWSGRSAPRVTAVPTLAPGPVQDVAGTAGDGQVSLSWLPGSTGGAPISSYTVWYSVDGVHYTQFMGGATITTTAVAVTGLSNGTAYTFAVYAVNADGTGPVSSPSGPVTPEAPAPAPPTAPTTVAVPGNATSPVIATLSFSLPEAETGAPYNGAPVVAGGTGPYTWSVVGGSLPDGLRLDPLTGAIYGTPEGGSSTFELQVADANGLTAERQLSVTVVPPPHISVSRAHHHRLPRHPRSAPGDRIRRGKPATVDGDGRTSPQGLIAQC